MKKNNRINIWIITAQENPSSVLNTRYKRLWRSNELARQLANRGHIVTRWRSSFNHQAKKQSNYNKIYLKKDGYNLQYIRTTSYYNHIGFKRVLSHYFLAKNFLKMIKQDYPIPPNLIFVSNVPIELCHAAVRYANKNNIPVVVDVRDLWPDLSYLKIPFETAIWRAQFITGTDYFSKKPEIPSLNRVSLLQFADFDNINPKGGSSPGLLGDNYDFSLSSKYFIGFFNHTFFYKNNRFYFM